MDPRIEEYIRANRRKYTREAITKQLEEAGHDRAAIDATWAAFEARDPDETVGEAFWARFLIFVLALNVAALLLVGVFSGMLTTGGGIFVLVILGVVLAIGALISWGVVALLRPTELSRGTAMAIGGFVPLLFTFLIAGSCYALIGGLGGAGQPAIQGTMTLEIQPPLEFEGSGPASCYPTGRGGFSVFSGDLGFVDGRPLNVSIDSFDFSSGDGAGPAPAPGPGGEVQTGVYIVVVPGDQNDTPLEYHTGPETTLDVDTDVNGLSGRIGFDGLTPNLEFPDADADAISGTITWTCE
jgi:hypothetical protein